MRNIPTVIASGDGDRAVEVLEFETATGIRNRDAVGFYFTVRLEPAGPKSRVVVIFSGTVSYVEPQYLGLAEIEDRQSRFVQYSLASIGELLDAGEVPAYTPSGTDAFGIECFSGQFQEWNDRPAALDRDIEAYLRSQVYWSWKFSNEDVEVGAPDRLRLHQSLQGVDRIVRLHEDSEWSVRQRGEDRVVLAPEPSFLRAIESGQLSFSTRSEENHVGPSPTVEVQVVSQGEPSPLQFVDEVRIADLKKLTDPDFDFGKLVSLCEELNVCYRSQCYHSVAALTRAVIDHVPPALGCAKFSDVVNNYGGGRSFSDTMKRLEGVRKIADSHLHSQIRRTESLPTRVQVNFSAELDVLLGEIRRVRSDAAKDKG